MKRIQVVASSIIAAAAAVCHAAPFDPQIVSAEAKFVAFADLEAGGKTTVGEWLLTQLRDNPEYQNFEQIMVNAAGFMPASDIRDVTIYGDKYQHDPEATILLRASFDVDRLATALGHAQGFASEGYNGHTVMNWIDEKNGRRIYACLFDETTIVMTASDARLKSSIDVLDDRAKALPDDSKLPRPADEHAWAFLAGVGLYDAPAVAQNEMLSDVADRALLSVGQVEQNTTLSLTLFTESPDRAAQTLSVIDGFKAIGAMAGNRRRAAVPERAKLISELARNTSTRADGNDVVATLNLTNDRAIQIIEKWIEMRAERNEK